MKAGSYEHEKFSLESDKEDRVVEKIDYKTELDGQQAPDIARRPAEHALRENSKSALDYVKNIITPQHVEVPGSEELQYHDVVEDDGGSPDKQDIARTHREHALRGNANKK